jgi:hypothetical protein
MVNDKVEMPVGPSATEEMNALLHHCNLFTAASGRVSRMMDPQCLETLKSVRRQPFAPSMYPNTLIAAHELGGLADHCAVVARIILNLPDRRFVNLDGAFLIHLQSCPTRDIHKVFAVL